MKIPDVATCFHLLEAYAVPPHIVDHSVKVAQVGVFLAQHLNRTNGCRLDCNLVVAASLLHDITKIASLESGDNHALTACELLGLLGYHAVAEVVRQHVVLEADAVEAGRPNEAQIVFYADKRVKHAEIVGLDERFRDIKERYGGMESRNATLRRLHLATLRLEKHLFMDLDFGPEILNQLNGDEPAGFCVEKE